MANFDKLHELSKSTKFRKSGSSRDKKALFDLELDDGVGYVDHPESVEAAKSLNADLPKAVDDKPGNAVQLKIRLPDGHLVDGIRMLIEDISKVTLCELNPRINNRADYSSLVEKFKISGGNVTPVVCRLVNGKVELIAGLRRHDASIAAGTDLLCDVITEEISDETCESIALVENADRDNPDVWAMAIFYHSQYMLQRNKTNMSKTDFAVKKKINRQHLQDYTGLASVPLWLINMTSRYTQPDEFGTVNHAWSIRLAKKLKAACSPFLDGDAEVLKEKLGDRKFTSPAELIAAVKKLSNVDEPVESIANSKKSFLVDDEMAGQIKFGKRKQTLTLVLNEKSPQELREKITALLNEFGVIENENE